MALRLVSAFLAVSLLGLIAVSAFWIGRASAPAPRFAAGEGIEGDPLAAAWLDFERAQRETLALLRDHDFASDDLARAEALRAVLYGLVGAIEVGALLDPDAPRFLRFPRWTSKSGLDHPDDETWVALLRDDAAYRVTGTRGTTAQLTFQLLAGFPGVSDPEARHSIAVLDDRGLATDPEGGFEVIVSRRDPGAAKNWLRMDDGGLTLQVRHTFADWDRERAGALAIERIGGEGEPAAPLTPEEMAARLRTVARLLFDRAATGLGYAQRAWNFLPRNGVSEVLPSTGGLAGHYSAFGTFELGDDEALVLTTSASDAAYQSVQLGSLWFVSLDAATHSSSLNTEQAYRSDDGRYHFVVSLRDPGIQNWLDPEGHRRGLLMLRWEGLARPLSDDAAPRARVVAFDALGEALPADVPRFDAEARAAQRRARRAALQARETR